MSRRYEVLLRRDNGFNKTVYIDDCYSEQEARETAEAMYGMEVLRVIWAPHNTSSESQSSAAPSFNFTQGDSVGSLTGFAALIALIAVLWAIMFVVQYWYIFVPIVVILGLLIWYGSQDD